MIKKGNRVEILCGKDKGKKAEVIEILRSENKAKVKGINIIKKHEKTTKEKKGGIFSKENFLHISNLSIIKDSKKLKKTEVKKWYQDWKKYILKKYNLTLRKNLVLKIILNSKESTVKKEFFFFIGMFLFSVNTPTTTDFIS